MKNNPNQADWSDLKTRTKSGFLIAALGLGSATLGGPIFAIICAFIAVILLYEFWSVTDRDNLLKLPFLSAIFGSICMLPPMQGEQQFLLLMSFAAFILIILLVHNHKLLLALGSAYIATGVASVFAIRMSAGDQWPFWALIAIVVATDIGAYFAGRHLRGPKLWPKVSPSKTWSGFFGGTLAALAAAFIVVTLSGAACYWTFMAIPVSVVSQLGDLGESSWKRYFKTKDSSDFIPGHGGFLDRLDGLLAAGIAWFIVLKIFGAL